MRLGPERLVVLCREVQLATSLKHRWSEMEPVILSLVEEAQAVAVSLGRNHHRFGTVARTRIAVSAEDATVDVVRVMAALVKTAGNSAGLMSLQEDSSEVMWWYL